MNGEGLHRDLASTGTAIGRGDFLRYSFGAGALALFGCGSSLGDVTSCTPLAPTLARRPVLAARAARFRRRLPARFPAMAPTAPTCSTRPASFGEREQAVAHLLAPDVVFSDGVALELATVTGSTAAGLIATLTVAVLSLAAVAGRSPHTPTR